MSASWIPGRGFVRAAANNAKGAAVKGFWNGPPSTQSKKPASTSNTNANAPGGTPSGDDDIRAYRDWQASRSNLSNLGTHKYWTDPDDTARSLGGIGVDFNRQQYNLRSISPRNTGRKFHFLDPNKQGKKGKGGEEEGGDDDGSSRSLINVRPGQSSLITDPGDTPVASRSHNLTNVGTIAGEIGTPFVPFGEIGTGRDLNFQTQVGRGPRAVQAGTKAIGEGPTPTMYDPPREIAAAPSATPSRNTEVGKTRRPGGLGDYGRSRIYGNLTQPDTGNTAAAMSGRTKNVIDTTARSA